MDLLAPCAYWLTYLSLHHQKVRLVENAYGIKPTLCADIYVYEELNK